MCRLAARPCLQPRTGYGKWDGDLKAIYEMAGGDSRGSKEDRLFAIPSSRNLLAPEGVQAAEEFFQAGEG